MIKAPDQHLPTLTISIAPDHKFEIEYFTEQALADGMLQMSVLIRRLGCAGAFESLLKKIENKEE